jgi:ribosome-binding factor A
VARKRNPRIDKQVRAALADLIETEAADPRLAFVTITEADVTPDHEVATIYYSTLEPTVVSRDPRRSGGDRIPDADEVAAGLEAAAPRLRGMLSRRVGMRTTPELRFSRDPVTDQVSRLDELLRGIDTTVEVPPGTGGIEEAERAAAELEARRADELDAEPHVSQDPDRVVDPADGRGAEGST